MENNKKINIKNTHLTNTKFPAFLKSQPIDNLFVQSLISKMEIKKQINIFLPPTKNKKITFQNIFIDNNLNLNYQNENDDIKINEYLNYLISKGIIIKQENSSSLNYIINESIRNTNININSNNNLNAVNYVNNNWNNNNVIEKINNIEILKRKRFIIPQIMAQIYIEKEKKEKENKINSYKIDNKIKFKIISNVKKGLEKQLIDSISLSNSENREIFMNGSRSRNKNNNHFINLKNKSVSMNFEQENNKTNEINIYSSLPQNNNKIIKYISQRNIELKIIQTKKNSSNYIQYLENFIIFSKEKKPYEKSYNNSFFIQSKPKSKNNIQKIEQLTLLRKKKLFFIIDNQINLLIYPDIKENNLVGEEEEYEDKDENENDIYNINNNSNNSINSNNEINIYNINNNNTIKLRNKKKPRVLKNLSENNKNDISYIIETNENLYIENAYDMLVVEKNWNELEMEKTVKNLFIKGERGVAGKNMDINGEIQINKIDIKGNNRESLEKENKNKNKKRGKDWNKIIFPKFNNYIKIIGNKNKSKKEKELKNEIIKEIWFYIPGNERSSDFLFNANIDNNYRYFNKQNLNNIIKKEINFIINGEKALSNFITPRITEPEFKINKNINIIDFKNNNDYNNNDNINIVLKNKNIKQNKNINDNNELNVNILKNKNMNHNKNINNNNELNVNLNVNKINNRDILKKLVFKNANNTITEKIIHDNKITKNNNINKNINLNKKNNIKNKNIPNNKNTNDNTLQKNSNLNNINNNIINIKKADNNINTNINYNNINDNKKGNKTLKLFIYNYSIKDYQNNNNKINYNYNSNNINLKKRISNDNEDIVNIGNASSNIILNNNTNINNNKYNTIEIINTNYLIQKDKNYFPKKKIIKSASTEEIVQNDYNYFNNENEILNEGENQKIIIQNENKRYAEDNGDCNDGIYGILPIRRSKSISNYKHLFKSKSKERMNLVDKNRKNMIKSNSQKNYELLRDYSFEQNNYN